MKYDPEKHHRRSIRLKNYDYSRPGAYYITIVTQNRECFFGEIANGEIRLNECGQIARQCWLEIPNHFLHARLDEFVIMPNHVHGIIILNNISGGENIGGVNNMNWANNIVGAKNFSPLRYGTSKTIGSIVRGFKIGVTKWFRQNTDIFTVWQRNYYEHIIRNHDELIRIRQYIINNPIKWANDRNFRAGKFLLKD